MSQDTVQQIESNINKATEIVEMYKSLIRLQNNRDFKKLIKEGYLEQEAIRLVHLKADPVYQTGERQAAIDKDISAIGGLLQFFRTVAHNAGVAEKSIEFDRATREDILSEEQQ